MKSDERDNLLIRLDERTCNIWVLVEKQEKHLDELNQSVAKNILAIAINKNNIRWLRWSIIGVGSSIFAAILKLFGLY